MTQIQTKPNITLRRSGQPWKKKTQNLRYLFCILKALSVFCVLLNEKSQHWPQSSILLGGKDNANILIFFKWWNKVYIYPIFSAWPHPLWCGALHMMIRAFDCRRSHRSDGWSPDFFSRMFFTVAPVDFIPTFWFISEFHLSSLTIDFWINKFSFFTFHAHCW